MTGAVHGNIFTLFLVKEETVSNLICSFNFISDPEIIQHEHVINIMRKGF